MAATMTSPYIGKSSAQSICVDGHMLMVSTAGDPYAPPVIMVHGWSSHRGVWHQTMDALKDRHFCISVDLLGFGGSEKPVKGDYSIPMQGERILAIADALGIDRFTYIGHSMGGQIGMNIAANLAPERVTKLVSVAGVVSGKLQPFVERVTSKAIWLGYKLPFLFDVFRQSMVHFRPFAYISFRPWFYNMENPAFETWQYDREMAFQPGIHAAMYYAGRAIHAHDLRPHLHKIFAPTLAIFGHQDRTVPTLDGELIVEFVPDSELVLIDNCGHFPMYEQPAKYLKAIEAFLDE